MNDSRFFYLINYIYRYYKANTLCKISTEELIARYLSIDSNLKKNVSQYSEEDSKDFGEHKNSISVINTLSLNILEIISSMIMNEDMNIVFKNNRILSAYRSFIYIYQYKSILVNLNKHNDSENWFDSINKNKDYLVNEYKNIKDKLFNDFFDKNEEATRNINQLFNEEKLNALFNLKNYFNNTIGIKIPVVYTRLNEKKINIDTLGYDSNEDFAKYIEYSVCKGQIINIKLKPTSDSKAKIKLSYDQNEYELSEDNNDFMERLIPQIGVVDSSNDNMDIILEFNKEERIIKKVEGKSFLLGVAVALYLSSKGESLYNPYIAFTGDINSNYKISPIKDLYKKIEICYENNIKSLFIPSKNFDELVSENNLTVKNCEISEFNYTEYRNIRIYKTENSKCSDNKEKINNVLPLICKYIKNFNEKIKLNTNTYIKESNINYGNRIFGRKIELYKLSKLFEKDNGICVIKGEKGIGKTSLINFAVKEIKNKTNCVYFNILCQTKSDTIKTFLGDIFDFNGLTKELIKNKIETLENNDNINKEISQFLKNIFINDDVFTKNEVIDENEYYYNNILSILQRLTGKIIIYFENIHYADNFTIGLLEHITDRILNNRINNIYVLCSLIEKEQKSSKLLSFIAKIEENQDETYKNIYYINKLPPLAKKYIVSIIETLNRTPINPEDLNYILERGKRNPFHTKLLLKALKDDDALYKDGGKNGIWRIDKSKVKIHSLRELINRELFKENYDDKTKLIIKLSAIAGESIDVNFLYNLSKEYNFSKDETDKIIKKLIDDDIFDGTTHTLRFTHPLYRESLFRKLLDDFSAREYLSCVTNKIKEYYANNIEKYYEYIAYISESDGQYENAIEYYYKAENNYNLYSHIEEAGEISNKIISLHNKHKLSISKDIINRTYAINNLYKAYICINQNYDYYDEALEYCNKAIQYENGYFYSYLWKGIIYTKASKFDESIKTLLKAEELLNKVENDESYNFLIISTKIGLNYNRKMDYDKVLEYYNKALSISEKNMYTLTTITIIKDIANVYFNKKEYDKALKYYEDAIKKLVEVDMYQDNITSILYYSIGKLYNQIGNYNDAIKNIKKAIKIYKLINRNDSLNLSYYYRMLGNAYKNVDDYDASIEYFMKALSILEKSKTKDNLHIAYLYLDISRLFKKRGDEKNYKLYIATSINIMDKIGETERINKIKEEEGIKK